MLQLKANAQPIGECKINLPHRYKFQFNIITAIIAIIINKKATISDSLSVSLSHLFLLTCSYIHTS